MNIKAKLLNYIEKKNISKAEFYRISGLSNGFLDKEGSVTSQNLENILNNFEDLNIEWLLLDRGKMLKNSFSQSVVGDNNVNLQAGVNNSINNRQYYSDSPEVLRATIDALALRVKEKDAQIKEKDAQINKLLGILEK
jgi:hypothetical protein